MTKKQPSDGMSAMKVGAIGAGLAGIAATAYFFLGPKGKTNQKHAKAWAIKMKGDVIEKLERAQEVSEPIYHQIIDTIAGEYTKNQKAGKEEVDALAQDLKKHWKTISKITKKTTKKIKK